MTRGSVSLSCATTPKPFLTIFLVLGDDDSGCGESASSGDESAPSGDLHHLIEDSNNLEEDYEKYMNEIRKERQTENKTNVPDVIAALMDEYGG